MTVQGWSHPRPTAFASSSDADYARHIDSARLGGGAVSWSSKLQSHVARPNTEAEFIAGESCIWDMACFQSVLEDLGYKMTIPQALGMNSESAIRVAKNPSIRDA